MSNIARLIAPEELGEPSPGDPAWAPDLHYPKYRVFTEEMQHEERLAEKKSYGQFADEAVPNAQQRILSSIPKNNLRIPFKWFDNDSDAEIFFKAVARTHDLGVHRVGKRSTVTSLCMLLDVVSKHRGLRMKNKGDPPRMSLQDRRNRHWQAVIDESSLARDFSLRLVRHVTVMLVSAHLAFAESNGPWNANSTLNDKIVKVSEWLEENDPEDGKSFEYLQPKRPEVDAPRQKGKAQRKGGRNKRKHKAAALGPDAIVRPKRRRQTNTPSSPPRTDQTQPPLPIPAPDVEVDLPERIAEAKGGKRDLVERV